MKKESSRGIPQNLAERPEQAEINRVEAIKLTNERENLKYLTSAAAALQGAFTEGGNPHWLIYGTDPRKISQAELVLRFNLRSARKQQSDFVIDIFIKKGILSEKSVGDSPYAKHHQYSIPNVITYYFYPEAAIRELPGIQTYILKLTKKLEKSKKPASK